MSQAWVNFHMILEAGIGERGGNAIRDEWGPRGCTSALCLAHGWSLSCSPTTGALRDAAACPAGLNTKAGRWSLPSLSAAMLGGHDEFSWCWGQLRPAE